MSKSESLRWWQALGLMLAIAVPGRAAATKEAERDGSRPVNPIFYFDNGLDGRVWRDPEILARQLDLVKRYGFDGISWRYGRGQVKYPITTLLDALDRRGLKLYGVQTVGTLTEQGIVEPTGGYEKLFAALKGRAEAQVWVCLYSSAFKRSDPAGDAVAVAALRRLAGRADRYGLTVVLYPHIHSWHERFDDCIRVAEKVDRPNFGAMFNLCHCLQLGGEDHILEMLERAGPRLRMVNLNGADAGAAGQGWKRLLLPLDQGTYDLRPLLRKLKAIGYTGPIGVQCWGIRVKPEQLMQRTMSRWEKLKADL